MNCSVHSQAEAAGICIICGKMFCEDCLIEIKGKYYCKEHVKQLLEGGIQEPTPAQWSEGGHRVASEQNGNGPRPYSVPPTAPPYTGSPARPAEYSAPPYAPGYVGQPGVVINNTVNATAGYMNMTSPKSRLVALLLCIFFGLGGFHRFYCGKIGTGLLWFFTGGFFFFGAFVDFWMILAGSFRDGTGRIVERW